MRSTGTLQFSPEIRPGSHTRRDGGSTWWWLIIRCNEELGRLFRHLYSTSHYRTRSLQAPLWGTHISVIRGEEPPNQDEWGRLDGTEVEFEYDAIFHETDDYVWCLVECEAVLDLRERLLLPRSPVPALHLTIGNCVD
mgnify:CR=1 FL=1